MIELTHEKPANSWEDEPVIELDSLEISFEELFKNSPEPAKPGLTEPVFGADEEYLQDFAEFQALQKAERQRQEAERAQRLAQRRAAVAPSRPQAAAPVTTQPKVAPATVPVPKIAPAPTTNGYGSGKVTTRPVPTGTPPRKSGGIIISEHFKGDHFPALQVGALPPIKYEVIRTQQDLEDMVHKLLAEPVLAVDTETNGIDPFDNKLLLIQIATPEISYIMDAQKFDLLPLRRILENPRIMKILQNAKFDYEFLKERVHIELNNMYDTMLAERLLTAGLGVEVNLAALTKKYTGQIMDKSARKAFIGASSAAHYMTEQQLTYAAKDTLALFPIYTQQLKRLREEQLLGVADLEFKCAAAVGDLELAGCKIDTVKWRKILADVEQKRDAARHELMGMLPGGSTRQASMFGAEEYLINLNSGQQIISEFGKLGIQLEDTSEATLSRHNHPVVKKLLEYRGLEKTLGSFGESLLANIRKSTGRIHPDFIQYGADTGRFSCSNPNVQQIPATSDFRACFIPTEGYKMITSDYSQAELRILAELSRDDAFMEAFHSDGDLHIIAASQMFNVPRDQVTKVQRGQAKAINFGLAYGMGPQGLAVRIDKSVDEARDLISAYFKAFSGVQKWLDKAGRDSVKLGYSPTPLGRKRYYHRPVEGDPDYRRRLSEIERQGKNAPIQGCVSGDTRIFEESFGYVPIKKLEGRAVSVWDGKQYSKATVVYSGKKQLVKIRLGGGYYIECSPDHRFLTRGTAGKDVWKTPGDFKAQDRIVLSEALPAWSYKMTFPAHNCNGSWNAKKNISLEQIENPAQLGEWLGRLASDGTVTNTTVSLMVAEHEEVILSELIAVSEQLSYVGKNVRVTEKQPQRFHKLVISSRGLAEQLKVLGIKERIPDCAWQDSRVLAGYLRGMFDGDGTVNPDGALLVFGQHDKHLEWAREIQQALLLFGIRSRLVVNTGCIHLRILKKDMPLFCEKIGFINPEKQAKAEQIKAITLTSKIYGRAASILSVEVTDEWIEMYDVVNSQTGQFMANGLVVHNCNADMTKMALVFLRESLKKYDARVVNTVHDEIVVEVREDQADEVCVLVEAEMVRAGAEILRNVPVKSDAKVGDYWSK